MLTSFTLLCTPLKDNYVEGKSALKMLLQCPFFGSSNSLRVSLRACWVLKIRSTEKRRKKFSCVSVAWRRIRDSPYSPRAVLLTYCTSNRSCNLFISGPHTARVLWERSHHCNGSHAENEQERQRSRVSSTDFCQWHSC